MEIRTFIFDPLVGFSTLFLVALVIFHLLLVWPRNISKTKWKYIDYVWLSVAFMTIVTVSSELRIKSTGRAMEVATSRVESMYDLFSGLYVNTPPSYICRKFVRSEYSPDDLELTQIEYDKACEWFTEFSQYFSVSSGKERNSVSIDGFRKVDFSDSSLEDILHGMKKQLSYYNDAVEEREYVDNQKKYTELEKHISSIWPVLFIIALALRIAKTTGEIRHES